MYILIFIAGSVFTLLMFGTCLVLAFKITEYKEDLETIREAKKKKALLQSSPAGAGVIRPKTKEQIALDKDETAQAFEDLLKEI